MIDFLSMQDPKEKIVKYINDNASAENNKRICYLPTSKKELALYLRITPETLSRTLTTLKKSGVIKEIKNKGIEILW